MGFKNYLKIRFFNFTFSKVVSVFFVFFLVGNIAGAQDYVQVRAEAGDGIYSLLRRNGLPPEQYAKKFIELNKSALGKNNTLFVGRTYKLPVTSLPSTTAAKPTPAPAAGLKTVVVDIFGPQHRNVTIIDDKLKGAVFHLVAGHGGPDPGAILTYGRYKLPEDEYAYDVTLRLARRLMEHGATVYMIIWDPKNGIRDETILQADKNERCYPNLPIPAGHKTRLQQRVKAVNSLYAKHKGQYQRLVEIHLDSEDRKKASIDVFFHHARKSEAGKAFSQTLRKKFYEKYNQHQPNRGYRGTASPRQLYVIEHAIPVAVLIELGNMHNTQDQQRFMKSSNRQALANWLTEGLIEDFRKSK